MPLYLVITLALACTYLVAALLLHRQSVRTRGTRERLRTGMEIHLSAYGQLLMYASTRDQTDNKRFQAAWSIEPYSSGPVTCVHPRSSIAIHVQHGRLTMVVRGKKKILAAGESIEIPSTTPYRYFNANRDPVRATFEATPANAMDMFLVQMDRSGVGHERRPGLRTCLQALSLATTYDCTYAAALPVGVQRAVSVLAAPIVRLMGIRTYYAE